MLYRIVQRALLSSICCFFVLTTCSPIVAQNSGNDRPFHGSGTGSVIGQIPPNGLILAYQGNATHLGKFTRDETLFLNPDGSFVGQLSFKAANGDRLFANVTGQFISPTTAVGNYNFAGGTGRFSNATGQAEFEAVTPNGVDVAVRFSGRIRY